MVAPSLVIYEKSSCSACRKLTGLLRKRGIDYEAVEYQVTGLTQEQIRDLLDKLDSGPREILRMRGPMAEELDLANPERYSDDELIALMAEHPQLMQRPIVVCGDRAVLARPAERALELLN